MALHEQSVGKTDEWYTPAHVFEAMAVRFDLDVAAPTDKTHLHVPTSRWLTSAYEDPQWHGFIWMNPPFGGRNGLAPWLEKFFAHGNGVCLVPDRTSAPWWQDYAPKAHAILFVRKKLRFIRPDGSEGKSPAQGTTLMAAGAKGQEALSRAAAAGLGLLLIPSHPHGWANGIMDKPEADAGPTRALANTQTPAGQTGRDPFAAQTVDDKPGMHTK